MATFEHHLQEALAEQDRHAPGARTAGPGRSLEEELRALTLGPRRPRWAAELDVDPSCGVDGLRRAFRRRALETHPDRPGGSHEAFLRCQRALEEGLAVAR